MTAEIGGMRDDVSGMPVICANSSSQIRAREQVDFARYVSITKSRHMSRDSIKIRLLPCFPCAIVFPVSRLSR